METTYKFRMVYQLDNQRSMTSTQKEVFEISALHYVGPFRNPARKNESKMYIQDGDQTYCELFTDIKQKAAIDQEIQY